MTYDRIKKTHILKTIEMFSSGECFSMIVLSELDDLTVEFLHQVATDDTIHNANNNLSN